MEIVEFKIEDAIKIQKFQLRTWKKVLIPEVYNDLKFWMTYKNDKAEDGWDIRNGDLFLNFVIHYYPHYKKEVKEIKELLDKVK